MTTIRTQFGSVRTSDVAAKPDASIYDIMKHTLSCFKSFKESRALKIEELAKNEDICETSATLKYDFEVAPLTSNREMLYFCGLDFPSDDNADDADFTDTHLPHVINSLGAIGVFIFNTNHLTDAQLYRRLMQVLDEEIHFIPPLQALPNTWTWQLKTPTRHPSVIVTRRCPNTPLCHPHRSNTMVAPNPNSDTPPTLEERVAALEARIPVIAKLFDNTNDLIKNVHDHSRLVDGKVNVVKRAIDTLIDFMTAAVNNNKETNK